MWKGIRGIRFFAFLISAAAVMVAGPIGLFAILGLFGFLLVA